MALRLCTLNHASKCLIVSLQPLQTFFSKDFSTNSILNIKRKHISKWKNAWPDQVYFEGDVQERCFDKILDTGLKSKERRRRMFRLLLDRLIDKERVVVTCAKGRALSRLAELLIDTAKRGDEPAVYCMIHRKELIPHVFDELLPRYMNQDRNYTKLYRLHSESLPFRRAARLINREAGNSVVEFIGNDLPPLLPTRDQLETLTLNRMIRKKEDMDQITDGTDL